MFVYDMNCIDFFDGMTKICDYIKLIQNDTKYYPTYKSFKAFLIKCFVNARICGWEGDIRNEDCIGISAIPMMNGASPSKLLAFKQDNNGSSFLVSEHLLSIDSEEFGELLEGNKTTPDVLMYYFDESYDLVERICSDSISKQPVFALDNTPVVFDNTPKIVYPADTEEERNPFEGVSERDFR